MVKGLRVVTWAYGVAGIVCCALYVQSSSPLLKAVLLCTLSVATLAAITLGVIVHRPRHALPWLLMGALQLTWTVGWFLWESRIVSTGMPPTPDSLVNFAFLSGYPLLVAALLLLLVGRERSRISLVDMGIVLGALFVVAWALLLHHYIGDPTLPPRGQAIQIAYGICDIAVIAVILRLLVSAGSRSAALVLLLAGSVMLVFSDLAWNWSTRLGAYTPGAWADAGWVLGPVCLGVAALLPSMATLYESPERASHQPRLNRGRLALVIVATFVGPLVALYDLVWKDASPAELRVLIAAAGFVSMLVVYRLALNLREADRLSAELERRNRSLAELAAIIESTSDAVLSATRDRKITSWNLAAERLFGYTKEEAIGRSIGILAPGELEDDQLRLRDEMVDRKVATAYEAQRAHKDGRLIDVAMTLSPLLDEAGDVVGFSSIMRDVSEHKTREVERERVRTRLVEQNERLEALDRMKDDFVASVSHELRTPLTSIRGYLELVLDGEAGELTPTQARFLAVVQRNADRLLGVVGDLLFVAQIDAGRIGLEPAPVRFDDLAEEAVEAARPAAVDKDIELALDTDGVGELVGDGARLAQVLDNLVSNAVKFTPSGGRVSVRAYREHDRAVVEVADTGLGISAEDQERLFERFFRTEVANEQSIQGTGLGLAIVKAIVEAHGGEISVTSEVGLGSTFRVAIPLDRTAVTA